jgi:hypothetical protein
MPRPSKPEKSGYEKIPSSETSTSAEGEQEKTKKSKQFGIIYSWFVLG